MFLDLIKLYNRQNNSGKTPLEDFNTECFANILKLYPETKVDFIENFLKLPIDEYVVSTQVRKNLIDSQDCIIDLVFTGKTNVCFIECKVESSEGWEQLTRYANSLDLHYPTIKKYLLYLTKYSDIKNLDDSYSKYNFKQIRWYEVANFLKKYSETNPLITEYIKFLKQYNMEQDNTLKSVNLIAMENLHKTLEIINFHLANSKENFKNCFKFDTVTLRNTHAEINNFNRASVHKKNVLKCSKNVDSEILYSIELETLKLNVQIFVNSNHEQFSKFKSIILNHQNYKTVNSDFGFKVILETHLGNYLNDDGADKNISNWFLSSFKLLKNLIEENNQLEWNI